MKTLESNIREFLGFLRKVEVSDNGRAFRPNQISSCRVMDGQRMGELLVEMEKQLGLKPLPPLIAMATPITGTGNGSMREFILLMQRS